MQDFRGLEVWEESHQIALEVYRITAGFPRTEAYGLTSQMRRAAASVPSNIAEGCGRGGAAEFARYLQISMGSASELDYQLLLARDLGFISEMTHGELERLLHQMKRRLNALLQRVRDVGPTRVAHDEGSQV